MKKLLRFVVIGDPGVGKSCLIATSTQEVFPHSPPPVLPPINLPASYWREPSPIQMIDTSSNPRDKDVIDRQVQTADIVLLCFGLDSLETLSRIHTYWLPELRRLRISVPVLMVGCKLDTSNVGTDEIHKRANRWMQDCTSVEAIVIVSSKQLIGVSDLITMAINMVIYPVAPIYNDNKQQLTRPALKAFDRIFNTCDENKDGALNDDELQRFQMLCYGTLLNADEISGLKQIIAQRVDEGVRDNGITLHGFIFLFIYFIQKQQSETVWLALRAFGYETDFSINQDLLSLGNINSQDQHVELSSSAMDYITSKSEEQDVYNLKKLDSDSLDNIFRFCEENPFQKCSKLRQEVQVQQDKAGNLSLHGYQSLWIYWCSVDPKAVLQYLICLGYGGVKAVENKFANLPGQIFKLHPIHKRKKEPAYLKEVQNRTVYKISFISTNQNVSNILQDGLVLGKYKNSKITTKEAQSQSLSEPHPKPTSNSDLPTQFPQENVYDNAIAANHSELSNISNVSDNTENLGNINMGNNCIGDNDESGILEVLQNGSPKKRRMEQYVNGELPESNSEARVKTAVNVFQQGGRQYKAIQTYTLPQDQLQKYIQISHFTDILASKYNQEQSKQNNKNSALQQQQQNIQHILESSDLLVFVSQKGKVQEFRESISLLTQISDKFKNTYPALIVQVQEDQNKNKILESQESIVDDEQLTKYYCNDLKLQSPQIYKQPNSSDLQQVSTDMNVEQNRQIYFQMLQVIQNSKGHYPQTPQLKKMQENRKMIIDAALVSGISVGVGIITYFLYYNFNPRNRGSRTFPDSINTNAFKYPSRN